ncbi:MAG TPA: hypothetical protein DDW65_00625 [Firmicutes bacterium]|jgi:hypothetical protein|nr:hypothetical protein [Bacillota bacterium]
MDTIIVKHKMYFMYCIIICISLCFWTSSSTVLHAESQNSLTVNDIAAQSLGSIDLPQVQGPLYLECSLSKNRLYLGERVPITITLYVSELVVTNVDEPVLTQTDFVLDKTSSPSQDKLRINGRPYQVIKFHYLLSPLQTGSFRLGPISQTLYLAASGVNRRHTVDVSTSPILVKVYDVPSKGRPEHFSGGVGNFQLTVSATPRQVKLGEPVTIRMDLSGSGNLAEVSAPILKKTSGVKVYSALKKSDLSTNNGSWNKTTFEQIIIPVDKNLRQIGPFSFAYFDPNTGKYQQIEVPALSISVKSNPNFTNDEVSVTRNLSQSSLVPIKKGLGGLYLKNFQLINQGWFWLWQLLPLLLLLGAISYRRYTEFMQSDSPRARAIRSSYLVKQQLAVARSISAEERYDDLLDQLHLVLRDYLGEKFDLAAAGMTSSVGKILAQKGVPPEIVTDVQQFFEQYDSHRFAQTKLDQAGAAELWEKLNEIIAALDQVTEKN